MTGMTGSGQLLIIVALFAALPLVLLTRAGRQRWYALDASSWAILAGLWFLAGFLHVSCDAVLGLAVFSIVKLAAFSAFCALSPPHFVQWSATRAAIAATLVYLAIIPAMTQTPIDGDEPFYLLITESLVKDHDLDLTNQYRDIAHFDAQRPDLTPQPGDPVGAHGEKYSRHEPFLPLLMTPGYFLFGLPGAIATIALFGGLMIRSTLRFLEDEGISESTSRIVFPLFAFGPPVIFYAARIWPEVPAAFFFVEALRGIRQRRETRWVPALLGLVMLKLRFVPVAVTAAIGALMRRGFRRRSIFISGSLVIVPTVAMWFITGNLLNVHHAGELGPGQPVEYVKGFFGLLLDGSSGLLFQAPLFLASIFAITRWRSLPDGLRLGLFSAAPYLFLLMPRPEWHGGWAPPLRYVVFLVPVLALGVAFVMDRARQQKEPGALGAGSALLAATSAWSMMLVAHGLAYPWRLFHIASGENFIGETLSSMFASDYSRLFPSFIRPNHAATVAAIFLVLLLAMLAFRLDRFAGRWINGAIVITGATILLLAFLAAGRQAGDVVELEDAHVAHTGGALYPEEYTVARFLYRGGWMLDAGSSASFLFKPGAARLRYSSDLTSAIEVDGHPYVLPPSPDATTTVIAAPSPRSKIVCRSGHLTVDRIEHE